MAAKTLDEINAARSKLCSRVRTPGLLPPQFALVIGALNALVWAADGANASTMERLLSDEPLAAGQDSSADAMEHFAAALRSDRETNMATLIRRLARALSRVDPTHHLPAKSLDYLDREYGHLNHPSILREFEEDY